VVRFGEEVLVHIPQPLEIGWEEDVEISLFDKECAARNGLVSEPRLDYWCIDPRDLVGKGGKVRKEEPMPWEVSSERPEETEKACRDILFRREVGGERCVGVNLAEEGGCLEDAVDWGLVAEFCADTKERMYEGVGYRCVDHVKVALFGDRDDPLVGLHGFQVVTHDVVREVVLVSNEVKIESKEGKRTMTSIATKKHGAGSRLFQWKILR